MKHFLLARELPAIFALALVGAYFGFANGQPALGIWLLFVALWCFLFWVILMPWPLRLLRHTDHRDQPDHRQQRGNQQQRQKRCTTA